MNQRQRLQFRQWIRLLGCILVPGLILFVNLLPTQSATGEEIRIGMSAAFSGPSRDLGIELYRGSIAYLDYLNRAGGVHGRKVVLKAYDDGYNPLPAVRNTLALIEEDDVFVLFNYVGTPTVTRVLPLLRMHEAKSLFLLFPFTGAMPQRQPPYDQYVFNLRASYHEETAGLVDQFVTLGCSRFGVFYQIDAYGRSGWEGVKYALAKLGLHMVAESTYHRGAKYSEDLSRQVEILRQADVDVVISVGSYAACAAFIRDARNMSWNVPIANLSFVGSESLLGLLIEEGENTGRDYTDNLVISQVVPSYEDTSLPAVREYRELIEQPGPPLPSSFETHDYEPLVFSSVSFEGFLNAKLLAEILRRLGDPPEKSRIVETIEGIRNLDLGIDTLLSFGPARHQGMDAVYFTTVKGGRLVPVEDWSLLLK